MNKCANPSNSVIEQMKATTEQVLRKRAIRPMGGQTLAPDPQVRFLTDTRSSTPDDFISLNAYEAERNEVPGWNSFAERSYVAINSKLML